MVGKGGRGRGGKGMDRRKGGKGMGLIERDGEVTTKWGRKDQKKRGETTRWGVAKMSGWGAEERGTEKSGGEGEA